MERSSLLFEVTLIYATSYDMICLWNEDECAWCKIYDKEMHDIRSYFSKSMKSRIEYEAKIVKVEMLGHCLENKKRVRLRIKLQAYEG